MNKLARQLKFVLSLIFFAFDLSWEWIGLALGKKNPGTCVVLYYHVVTPEQRRRFAKQMDELIRLARPVSANFDGPLEPGIHHVAVTFDDGFECVAKNAIPELTKRRIPVAIFVPTGYFGLNPKWLKEKEHAIADQQIMTVHQLRGLKNDLVSIGSHCITHTSLLILDQHDAKREIFKSKRTLEEILGVDVKLLSFPHGAYNQRHVAWAKEAGYERVFTILPTLVFSDPEEFITGRIETDPSDWPLEFRLKLAGAYRWLPYVFALKRKISFMLGGRLY